MTLSADILVISVSNSMIGAVRTGDEEVESFVEIEVKLFASLRDYLPEGSRGFSGKIRLSKPVSVADVLSNELRMTDEVIQSIMLLMVNDAHAQPDQILSDGDVLTALPIVTGG